MGIHAAPSSSNGVARFGARGWIVHCFWILVLLMVTAPHARLLTGGDYFSVGGTASPYYSYFRRLVGLVCLLIIARKFRSTVWLLLKARTLVPFYLLALAAMPWAVDIRVSFVSFIDNLTIVVAALAAVVSLPAERLARVIVHLMGLTLVLCVVSVFLIPDYAVVQMGEPPGSGAPGQWRGMYGSKNALGHVAGLYVGALLFCGRGYYRRALPWLISIGTGIACVAFSGSTSALVILMAQGLIAAWIGRRASLRITVREVVLASALAIIALYAEQMVDALVTFAGKDVTFSGRDVIWERALWEILRSPWVGHGYGYTSSPDFAAELSSTLTSYAAVHFHNSFLDVAYNVGLPAMVFFFGVYVFAPLHALALNLDPGRRMARRLFITILGGWFVSGMTEIDAVRPVSALALIGIVSVFGLLSVTRYRAARTGLAKTKLYEVAGQ